MPRLALTGVTSLPEFAGRAYRRLFELLVLLTPTWIAIYFGFDSSSRIVWQSSVTHVLITSPFVVIEALAGYLIWQGYLVSRESALRWLSAGFVCIAVSDLFHCLDAVFPGKEVSNFAIYGAYSRLQIVVFTILSLFQFRERAENLTNFEISNFWRSNASYIVWSNLVLLGLGAISQTFAHDLIVFFNGLTVLLAGVGLAIILLVRFEAPIVQAIGATFALYAQASLLFLISTPQDSYWWFAHIVSGVGILFLGYALNSSFLNFRCVTAVPPNRQAGEQRVHLLESNQDAPQVEPTTIAQNLVQHRQLLQARVYSETIRGQVSGQPSVLVGFAIRRWAEIIAFCGDETSRLLKANLVSKLQSIVSPIDLVSSDEGSHVFVFLPGQDQAQTLVLVNQFRQLLDKESIVGGSFALRLDCIACLTGLRQSGFDAEKLLEVARYRLSIAEAQDLDILSE